jgi:hypothetical protein
MAASFLVSPVVKARVAELRQVVDTGVAPALETVVLTHPAVVLISRSTLQQERAPGIPAWADILDTTMDGRDHPCV